MWTSTPHAVRFLGLRWFGPSAGPYVGRKAVLATGGRVLLTLPVSPHVAAAGSAVVTLATTALVATIAYRATRFLVRWLRAAPATA